jgi:glycine/D-amino acid oxidase-like deaminating enzyme
VAQVLTLENAEIGNADDTSIDLAVSRFLHTFLPSQFSTESPVIREWTGIMGYSHDTHPYVGHSDDEPNKWVIGGFQGQGMVRIWLCAKALVEQLHSTNGGNPTPWPTWLPKAYICSHNRHSNNETYWCLSNNREFGRR